MTKKINIILFFLLLSQILIIVYVYRPGQEAGPTAVTFFDKLTPDQVSRLTIDDDEAKSIVLEKNEEHWLITSQDNLPADQDKAESLIKKVVGLKSSRVVTQTKTSHERLKVGKTFVRKISLTAQDGTTHSLIIGTAPSYQTAHVRLEDDNLVYLVKDLSAWEIMTEASSWWQNQYVDVDPAKLVELSLVNGNGTFSLKKDGDDGQWQVIGDDKAESVDQNKVLDFIEAASRITIADYLGKDVQPEYGLDKTVAELTLTTEDGAIQLQVGAAQDEEGNSYVLKASHSPFYVTANKYAITALVEQKAEDLLTAGSDTGQTNSQ